MDGGSGGAQGHAAVMRQTLAGERLRSTIPTEVAVPRRPQTPMGVRSRSCFERPAAATAITDAILLICAVGSCQAPVGEVVGGGRVGSATWLCVSASWGVLSPGGRPAGPSAERLTGAGLALSALCARGCPCLSRSTTSGWLRVGDMMVMGFPLGEGQGGRSVFGGRPRERGGSRMPGAGRGASA